MSRSDSLPGQLGFDELLESAAADNEARKFERRAAHLPGSMSEALPFYRDLTNRHHAAMLEADVDETLRLREEARLLALKLNGGEPGILAHEDGPGYVLARKTAADPGTVPLWGQDGAFEICVEGMRVRIEMEGMFGIGSGVSFWPGFSARAIDLEKPFLSRTGYRSFLGLHADPAPELTPERFTAKVITAHIARELKGKPVLVTPEYQ